MPTKKQTAKLVVNLKKIQDNMAHAVCQLLLAGDTENAQRILQGYKQRAQDIQDFTGKTYP